MTKISKQTLLSLRDFISDALSDPDISPDDIATAIRDELTDLIDYHRTAQIQAEKTLDLLSLDKETKEFNDDFNAWLKEPYFQDEKINRDFDNWFKDDVIEKIQDDLTYGNYEFKLNSDYMNGPIDFNKFKNKKNK